MPCKTEKLKTKKTIIYRTLDYKNQAELLSYTKLFWSIPIGLNEFFTKRTPTFINNWCRQAKKEENESNTFPGIAIFNKKIIGLYLLRRFEEFEHVGVHVAGIWVAPKHRKDGVASKLKNIGNEWASSIGAVFINANVDPINQRMQKIIEHNGFTLHKLSYRKQLNRKTNRKIKFNTFNTN